MEFLNVGAATTDLCLTCGDVVSATIAEHPIELEVSGVVVPDVLVAVCDVCGSTLSIPAQAEWQLREARVAAAEHKLTARVTRPQVDALHVIANALGAPEALMRARLFSYYLNLVRRDQAFAATLVERARSPLARGKKPRRFEVRLRRPVLEEGLKAATTAGLRMPSDLVAGVIAVAADDVLEQSDAGRRHDLEAIAASL